MLPTMELGGSRSFKMLTNIKFEKVWPHLTKKKKMWKKSVEMGWQSNANQSRGGRRNVELHTNNNFAGNSCVWRMSSREHVLCGNQPTWKRALALLYLQWHKEKKLKKLQKKKMRENVKNITKCVCLRETSPHIFWTWYFDYVPKTKDKNSMHILNDN